MFGNGNGIERAVKLAVGRLKQTVSKPVGYLVLDGFVVCIWDLALFDVNWIVLV